MDESCYSLSSSCVNTHNNYIYSFKLNLFTVKVHVFFYEIFNDIVKYVFRNGINYPHLFSTDENIVNFCDIILRNNSFGPNTWFPFFIIMKLVASVLCLCIAMIPQQTKGTQPSPQEIVNRVNSDPGSSWKVSKF